MFVSKFKTDQEINSSYCLTYYVFLLSSMQGTYLNDFEVVETDGVPY